MVESAIDNRRQTDKVVIWQTAISTGAFALILTQSNNLGVDNPIFTKVAIAMLLLGIIAGVVYRACFFGLEEMILVRVAQFEGYLKAQITEHPCVLGIDENHSIKDIARKLNEEMGIDNVSWLEYEALDRDFWVKHYTDWAEFWGKQEKEGMERLHRAVAVLSNENPDVADDEPEDESALRTKIYRRDLVCDVAYQCTSIFFVLAVISIGLGYLLSAAPAL